MSKIIQIQDINSSDTLKTMVEKINYNFDQIMAFGGGPKGEMGQRGFIGPDGEQGEQGERGNLITVVDDISTVGSDLKVGDIAIYSDNQYIYKVEEIDGEKHFVSTNICIKGNAGESGTSNSPFKYSEEGDAIVNSSNEKGVPKYTFIGTDTTINGHIGNLNVVGSDGIHIFTSTDNTGNDNGYCGKIYGDKLNSENILVLKGEDNPNNNYVKIDNTLLTDKIHSSNNAIKIAEITNNVIILGDKSNSTSIECNDFTIKNGSNTPIKTSSSEINLKGNLYVNYNDYNHNTQIFGSSINMNVSKNVVGKKSPHNKTEKKYTDVSINNNRIIYASVSINPGKINISADDITLGGNTRIDRDAYVSGNVTVQKDVDVKGNVTVQNDVDVKGNATANVNGVNDVYLGCPIGTIVMWAGIEDKIPDGWELCAGQSIKFSKNGKQLSHRFYIFEDEVYLETQYQKFENLIYAITGENLEQWPYTHSTIDSINLPNLQQRFPLGAKTNGKINTGYDNGEQTTKSTTLGVADGDSEVKLSVETMPSHNHTLSRNISKAGTQGEPNFVYDGADKQYVEITSNNTGDSKAHNNMPPFLAINFIIKYK